VTDDPVVEAELVLICAQLNEDLQAVAERFRADVERLGPDWCSSMERQLAAHLRAVADQLEEQADL
jgi:hypothetical protein